MGPGYTFELIKQMTIVCARRSSLLTAPLNCIAEYSKRHVPRLMIGYQDTFARGEEGISITWGAYLGECDHLNTW